MGRTTTYFISDIHLGAVYIPDARAHEMAVVDFLRHIEPTAKHIFLLGDILDYWFEYKTAVPRGYVRFFGELARLVDAGVRISWFTGNHDIWLFDYLRDEIGIEVIDTPTGGQFRDIDGSLFYLAHGDLFGPQPLSYRMLRAIFHNRICQRLYAAIHPRWSIPFAHGWSSHSRKSAKPLPRPVLSDDTRRMLIAEAEQFAHADPTLRHIIIGHHHFPAQFSITPACTLTVLGNWIDRRTYASFDGQTLSLKEYQEQ